MRFFHLSRRQFEGGYTCDFHLALATRQNLKKSHHLREQKIARVAAALLSILVSKGQATSIMRQLFSSLFRRTDIPVWYVYYYYYYYYYYYFRTAPHKNNKTTESFEVYGPRLTNTELLRQVYGILEQLLPVLKSDLYEDVDGEKVTGSNPLEPEESPLLPGSVKMHREANTSDKDTVLIKKHFDRTDFVSLSSDIDLDLKYSDSAFINKSNGMVTQSRAYLSEQLNFGEPIHDKSGSEVTAMKINLTIKVSLIELSNYFEKEESERVSVHYFVKLVLPKSKATFSVNEPSRTFSADTVLNSTLEPSVIPSSNQQHNKTNSSDISLKRSRRALRRLNFYKQFTVFEKKMIGINVKGKVEFWVYQDSEMGIRFRLIIGSHTLSPLISKRYPWSQLEDGRNVAITLTNRGASIVSANSSLP